MKGLPKDYDIRGQRYLWVKEDLTAKYAFNFEIEY